MCFVATRETDSKTLLNFSVLIVMCIHSLFYFYFLNSFSIIRGVDGVDCIFKPYSPLSNYHDGIHIPVSNYLEYGYKYFFCGDTISNSTHPCTKIFLYTGVY